MHKLVLILMSGAVLAATPSAPYTISSDKLVIVEGTPELVLEVTATREMPRSAIAVKMRCRVEGKTRADDGFLIIPEASKDDVFSKDKFFTRITLTSDPDWCEVLYSYSKDVRIPGPEFEARCWTKAAGFSSGKCKR